MLFTSVSHHIVVPMLVPQHVRGLLLTLPESVLGNGRREPQRDYPFGHIAEVHAADGATRGRPGEPRLCGQCFPESVERTRRQHLQKQTGTLLVGLFLRI